MDPVRIKYGERELEYPGVCRDLMKDLLLTDKHDGQEYILLDPKDISEHHASTTIPALCEGWHHLVEFVSSTKDEDIPPEHQRVWHDVLFYNLRGITSLRRDQRGAVKLNRFLMSPTLDSLCDAAFIVGDVSEVNYPSSQDQELQLQSIVDCGWYDFQKTDFLGICFSYKGESYYVCFNNLDTQHFPGGVEGVVYAWVDVHDSGGSPATVRKRAAVKDCIAYYEVELTSPISWGGRDETGEGFDFDDYAYIDFFILRDGSIKGKFRSDFMEECRYWSWATPLSSITDMVLRTIIHPSLNKLWAANDDDPTTATAADRMF